MLSHTVGDPVMLGAMNLLDQLIAVTRQGISLAEAAQDMSKHQLIESGVLPMDAQKIARVAREYFPATSAKTNAIEAARENGHSIVTLDMIESFAGKLENQRRAWGFRTRACRATGSHDEVRTACRQLLDEYNGPATPAPQTRSLQFINSKTKGTGLLFRGSSAEMAALRHAAHTAAAKLVGEDNVDAEACGEAFADMLTRGFPQSVLRPVVGLSLNEAVRIEDGRGDDIELVASDGSRMTGSEFLERLLRQAGVTRPTAEPGAEAEATFDVDALGNIDRPAGTATTTGVDTDQSQERSAQAATSVLTPAKDAPTEDAVTTGNQSDPGSVQDSVPEAEPGATLVPVPDADAEDTEGAPDLELFAAEIPRRIPEMVFDDNSMIMLVHPAQGPSNLYRTSRFANGKQRTMLGATFGVCAHPECNQPAEFCQVNHDTAWASGGMTNIDNLTPLCKYHNAANDDDPEGPVRHGRVERDGLDVYRLLPGGRRQRDATPTLARRMMAERAARRTAQAA